MSKPTVDAVITTLVKAPNKDAAYHYALTLPPAVLAAVEDQLFIEYMWTGCPRKETGARRIVAEVRA